MKLLISVRNVDEALTAASGGADFIDLKEPGNGALGGLPTATIREIVGALRRQGCRHAISATIGDVPMRDAARIATCVDAVGACAVDYVKVGIERGPRARAVLGMLANRGHAIVPVFIADQGIERSDIEHACALGFPALMADTADKHAGSLFDVLGMDELQRFVDTVRSSGRLVGLAGSLRTGHDAALRALAPDFAGFRTAVCAGDRSSTLDRARLHALVRLMHQPADFILGT